MFQALNRKIKNMQNHKKNIFRLKFQIEKYSKIPIICDENPQFHEPSNQNPPF